MKKLDRTDPEHHWPSVADSVHYCYVRNI